MFLKIRLWELLILHLKFYNLKRELLKEQQRQRMPVIVL